MGWRVSFARFRGTRQAEFRWALAAVALLALGLRFWHLAQPECLVFDEVYYAQFAHNYLTGTPFFNVHPPLSQYLIAGGLWLSERLPIAQELTVAIDGVARPTFGLRFANALAGSLVPLAASGVAYQLTQRRGCALLAGLFLATDGLFLVESRYALSNTYIVLFGLLAQWLGLRALRHGGCRWELALAGLCLGAAIATKWNGLGFVLGLVAFWGLARYLRWQQPGQLPELLQQWARLRPAAIAGYLGLVPLLTYSLLWTPHLAMNPQLGFGDVHARIWNYHQQVERGSQVHPYCSRWYSWPLMVRPVAYAYQKQEASVRAVHAMGNPVLWWASTVTVAGLLPVALGRWGARAPASSAITLFLLAGYAANWLPWAAVGRCTFIYHYLEAYALALIALAWGLERGWWSRQQVPRSASLAVLGLALAAFAFWLPVHYGLPLSMPGYQERMWFSSWI